ncbi:hypothetical protein FRB94_014484 [Tulasnella sp. JGI-2019a]|nr:hypothetical protein FRB94_014484 [Tulasnella sp. JGI-2019a]
MSKIHSMSEEYDPLDEIHALDACFDKFTTETHQIIANRRRSYNASLPIHQLPQELMSEILTLAIISQGEEYTITGLSYMQGLQNFASVSSAWARLIKDTPSFWTKVSDEYPPPLLHQTLLRPRGHLLDVKVTNKIEATSIDLFISLVSDHIHRWRSVDICEDANGFPMVETLCSAVAPALETLRLTSLGQGQQEETLFCGKADHLRNVHLTKFCIPWGTDILKGLVSLRLDDVWQSAPTVDQLLDILSASPGLTTLYLNTLYISDEVEDLNKNGIYRQPGFLELPLLKTFQISRVYQRLERALLFAIHFEGHINFRLNADLGLTYGLFRDPTFANHASFVRMSLALSKRLTVTYTHASVILELRTSTGCEINLSVPLPGGWGSAPPNGLVEALNETGSLNNRFIIRKKAAPRGMIPILLSGCSFFIIELNRPFKSTADDLMRFLATSVMVGDKRCWPVLDLEELDVLNTVDIDPQEVVKMVTARYGGEEIGASVTRMAPIRIWIRNDSSFKQHHLTTLQGVLGEINVIHDTVDYAEDGEELEED